MFGSRRVIQALRQGPKLPKQEIQGKNLSTESNCAVLPLVRPVQGHARKPWGIANSQTSFKLCHVKSASLNSLGPKPVPSLAGGLPERRRWFRLQTCRLQDANGVSRAALPPDAYTSAAQ